MITDTHSLYQSGRLIHTAQLIEDSVAPNGIRLTTMQLTYWRAIHAEFMTHRVFSRNASSSRAVPVTKMLEQVRESPAGPIKFLANQRGMQGGEVLDDAEQYWARSQWNGAAVDASKRAQHMVDLGVHKQFANRLLEPFTFINVIVTATEWENFFALRCHPDAQPEIQALADSMQFLMDLNKPKALQAGDFHLPYISAEERLAHGYGALVKMSTARCARVSYLTHDGKTPSMEADLKLYHQLTDATPMHASPLEHQAEALSDLMGAVGSGNFRGWNQHRKMLERGWKV